MGKTAGKFDLRKRITAIALTPDAQRVFAGTFSKQIEVWDVAEDRKLQTLSPPANDLEERKREISWAGSGDLDMPISLLAAMDGGKLLAAFAGHGYVRPSIQVWDTATYQPQLCDRLAEREGGQAAVSPDGRWLVWCGVSDASGTMHPLTLWDATTRQVANYQGAEAFAFSPDSSRLAVSIETRHDGAKTFLDDAKTAWRSAVVYQYDIEIWDVATRASISRMEGHEGAITCLAWLPDGRRLVSGGRDHTLKMWDVASGQELLSLPLDDAPDNYIKLLAVSPDGHRIAATCRDTITVWDDRTRTEREGWRQAAVK